MSKLDLNKPLERVSDGKEPEWLHILHTGDIVFEAPNDTSGFGWCRANGEAIGNSRGTGGLRNAPEMEWANIYDNGSVGTWRSSREQARYFAVEDEWAGCLSRPTGSLSPKEWEFVTDE